MTFGDLVIKLAAALALIAFVAAVRWARGRQGSERTFRLAYHGMTACLAVASVLLMAAILLHDFRFQYVIGYSSRDLPLIYLISAFWAGQPGTFLLWALFGALLGYPLFRRGSWEPATVMACYVPTIGYLLAMMLDPGGNPFRLAPAVPADGHGLNVLLQDPWMASHPPLVFLGYVAMTIPAVLALAALLRRTEGRWEAPALFWSLVAFVLLGSGIVLGGFWAYKVLGWGGYWGWDPVENASLIPWLVVTALIHALLVRRTVGGLGRTALVLALGGYSLVLYATFLTRSGVLADFSVHSFPAGSIYRILLSVLLITLGVSVWAVLRRRAAPGRAIGFELSWPCVLSSAIVLLALSAGLVLVGTSWPILSSLFGRPAAVHGPFYNTANLPLYVAVLGLLAVAPLLAWTAAGAAGWPRRLAPGLGLAVLGTGAAVVAGARGAGALALFFVALAAVGSNLWRLATVGRASLLHTGAPLAHVGFAMMFLGIVGSGVWGLREEVRLPLGQEVEAVGRSLTYEGHVDGSEPRDRWRVTVREPDGRQRRTDVGMFAIGEPGNESVMHKPAIQRGWLGDLYLAPQGLDTGAGASAGVRLTRGAPERSGELELLYTELQASGAHDGQGMVVQATIDVRRGAELQTVSLPLAASERGLEGRPVDLEIAPRVRLTLEGMSVEQGWIEVRVDDGGGAPALMLEASTKPLIGLLWVGTLLLGVGCTVAAVRRLAEQRALRAAEQPAVAPPKRAPRRRERKQAARVARAG